MRNRRKAACRWAVWSFIVAALLLAGALTIKADVSSYFSQPSRAEKTWTWIERFSWLGGFVAIAIGLVSLLLTSKSSSLTSTINVRSEASSGEPLRRSVNVPIELVGGMPVRGRGEILAEAGRAWKKWPLRRRIPVSVYHGLGGCGK